MGKKRTKRASGQSKAKRASRGSNPAKNKAAQTRGRSSGGGSRARAKGGGRKGLVVAAAVAVATAVVIIAFFGKDIFGPVLPKKARSTASSITEVRIYTADSGGQYLSAKKLRLSAASASSTEAAASAALKAVINDSSGTLPAGTRLKGVSVRGSTAFVDLSEEASSGQAGGSTGEILAIYSIVNTVAMNFPGIRDVQILIDGKKAATLAGHIDISQPIAPDKKLIEG